MSGEAWKPSAVGDLFMLTNHAGWKWLMRVTEIGSDSSWAAVPADFDDAMLLTWTPPEVTWTPSGEAS